MGGGKQFARTNNFFIISVSATTWKYVIYHGNLCNGYLKYVMEIFVATLPDLKKRKERRKR